MLNSDFPLLSELAQAEHERRGHVGAVESCNLCSDLRHEIWAIDDAIADGYDKGYFDAQEDDDP